MKRLDPAAMARAFGLGVLSIGLGVLFAQAMSSPSLMRLWTEPTVDSKAVISRKVDRTEHGTLTFALSTNCRYCDMSVDFYKSLLDGRPQNSFHAIAIFQEANLTLDEVYQVDFRELNIVGTPTLLLVDAKGEVVERWEGLLSEEKKADLLQRFSAKQPRSDPRG
jgi:hypothetical protein